MFSDTDKKRQISEFLPILGQPTLPIGWVMSIYMYYYQRFTRICTGNPFFLSIGLQLALAMVCSGTKIKILKEI